MPELTIPQGFTEEEFAEFSRRVYEAVGHLSDDIRVHGSRAAGTARPDSDIDIAIRVSPDDFDRLIAQYFKTPNPGSSKEDKMLHSIKIGKIQCGELKISNYRDVIQQDFYIKVDISAVRIGGPFDSGPYINLVKDKGAV